MANHWISLLIYSLSKHFLLPWDGHRNMGQRRDVLLVEERYPEAAWTLSKPSVQVWTSWNFEFPRLSRDFLFFMSDSSY